MKFLFDNNLPPDLAHAIGRLSTIESAVEKVVHLTDLFSPATPDMVWIDSLRSHGSSWYILSQDKFKKSHGAEREVLRRQGHTVYVLDPQWSSQNFWAKSARLVLWWPAVLQHAGLTQGGVHRIPWRHTSANKFQSI